MCPCPPPNDSSRFHAVVFITASLLFGALSGCGDSPTALGPNPNSGEVPIEAALSLNEDSLVWVNNVLTFHDQGSEWRIERDSSTPTEFEIFQDSVSVMEGTLSYDGSEVDVIELGNGSESADFTADGELIDTSLGSIGFSCDPYETNPENVWYCSGGMDLHSFGDDCDEEFADVRESGHEVIGAGIVTLVTAKIAPPLTIVAAGVLVWKTAEHTGDLLDYAMCRFLD